MARGVSVKTKASAFCGSNSMHRFAVTVVSALIGDSVKPALKILMGAATILGNTEAVTGHFIGSSVLSFIRA